MGLLALAGLVAAAFAPSAQAAAAGSVGPVDASNGFPAFYADAAGTRLAPCLQTVNCVLLGDPGFNPANPVSFPGNFPSEWFYFVSDSDKLSSPGCGASAPGKISLRNAVEGSFFNGTVIPGEQITFTRLKIVVTSGLCANTAYRFFEPYGTIDITANSAGAISANKAGGTFDQKCGGLPCDFTIPLSGPAEGQATTGFVTSTSAPAGFLGDGKTLAPITGSPVGQDFFRVSNINPDGTTGSTIAETSLFSVAGKIAAGASKPDLLAADDSGSSNTDNITNNASPRFTGTSGPGDTVTLYDGATAVGTAVAAADGTWTIAPSTPLADGDHVMTATGTPAGGTESLKSVSLTVTVDTAAPADPTGLAAVGSGNPPTTTPKITGTAEAGSTVNLYTDAACATASAATGTAAQLGGAGIGVTVPANSTTVFDATATDVAGNVSVCSVSTATYSSVDTIPPTVTITNKPANPTNLSDVSIAFNANEPATFACDLDGNAFPGCTSPFTDPGVADGSHTFTVTATDPSGNVSAPATYTWTIDTGVITVNLDSAPAPITNNNTPSFAFSSNKAGATFQCSLVTAATATPSFAACTSPKAYTARANNKWVFTVKASDAAGNVATSTPYQFTIDTAAPLAPTGVTAVSVAGSSSQLKVSWNAATDSGPAGIQSYNVFRDGGATPVGTVVAPATTFTDTGLAAASTHSYTVQAVDAATNASAQSASASGTTNNIVDTQAPSVPAGLTAAAQGANGITLNWTASTDNVGVTGYKVYRDGGLTAIATVTTGTTFTDSGLAEASSHSYTVSAIDAAGNESAKSTAASARTADVTAPSVPTGVTVAAVAGSSTQLKVSWTASTDNVGVTGYKVYRDGGLTAIATVTTGTTFTDSGLAASSTHSYTVSAIDAAGNESATSTSASGTTGAAGDTIAPSVPTGLAVVQVAGSASQLRLSWTASTDNVGVTGYKVYRDGGLTAIATVTTGTTFTDSGLAASSTHSYTVSAIDAAGNESAKSASASATTQAAAAGPAAPASLTQSLAVAANTSLQATNVPVVLKWTASTGASGYTLQMSTNGGAFSTVGTTTTALTATQFVAPGSSYVFQVMATNANGASAPTKTASFSVSAAQETNASIVYAGAWTAGSNVNAYGGATKFASAATASATYTFTGKSIAFVSAVGTTRGQVKISVDGAAATTVNLAASATAWKRIVFTKDGLAAGTHTIKVTPTGTHLAPSTANRVDVDAFEVLN